MKIHFKEDYKPHAVHTPIPLEIHWEDAVKELIDRDVRLDIIEKVPEGTPGHLPQARRRAHPQPPQRAGAAGEQQEDHPLAAISSRKLQPELAAGSGNLTILASKSASCKLPPITSC